MFLSIIGGSNTVPLALNTTKWRKTPPFCLLKLVLLDIRDLLALLVLLEKAVTSSPLRYAYRQSRG